MNAKKTAVIFSIICIAYFTNAQDRGFEFGKITWAELDMKRYEQDTTAYAVVLNEFGDAFFDLAELNKIYLQYHIKIKILKEEGKKLAYFEIATH